jgi:hypothetical protein
VRKSAIDIGNSVEQRLKANCHLITDKSVNCRHGVLNIYLIQKQVL